MHALLSEATSEDGLREHSTKDASSFSGAVEEPPAPYLPSGAAGFSDAALAITEKIQARIFEVVSAANGDPVKLGWIHEQLAQHLRPPVHWPKVTPHVAPATGVVVPSEQAQHHQRRSATG